MFVHISLSSILGLRLLTCDFTFAAWYSFFKEAVEIAAAEKDYDALRLIRQRARIPAIQNMVDKILAQASAPGGK